MRCVLLGLALGRDLIRSQSVNALVHSDASTGLYGDEVVTLLAQVWIECVLYVCLASILVSCNESESDGSVPELEGSEPLRPSEPQVSAALWKNKPNKFLLYESV